VHVWDWATASAALSLNEGVAVYSVAWSHDGRRLASGSQNGSVTIWDASNGQRLLALAGHTGTVLRLAFSRDGTRLTSVAMDGLAKVWDVASGAEVATLYGNTTSVWGVAFHPDGAHLATTALDGTVRTYTLRTQELLDLARSRVTRQLTAEECHKFLHMNQCP
jgi:WD40 repeat protein